MRGVLLFLGFGVALASGCNTPVPGTSVDAASFDATRADAADAAASACSVASDCTAWGHARARCTSGACAYDCDTGYDDCDTSTPECETSITTASHCGACAMRCGADELCATGVCGPLHLDWAEQLPSPVSRAYDAARGGDGSLAIAGSHNPSFSIGGHAVPYTGGGDGYVIRAMPSATALNGSSGVGIGSAGADGVGHLAARSDGSVIATGVLHGAVDFGGPHTAPGMGYDVFVATVDAAGNPGLLVAWGSDGDDDIGAPVLDSRGDVNVAINVAATTTIGTGGMLGASGHTASGVVRIDPSTLAIRGNVFPLTATGNAGTPSLALDPSGDLLVLVAFTGMLTASAPPLTAVGFDLALLRLRVVADAYQIVDAHRIGGPGDQTAAAIAVAPDGTIAVGVDFDTPFDPGSGVIGRPGFSESALLIYRPDGALVGAHPFGGGSRAEITDVAFDAVGNVYVGARIWGVSAPGPITFEGRSQPITGGRDAALASLDVEGRIRFLSAWGAAGSTDEITAIVPDDTGQHLFVVGDFTTGIRFDGAHDFTGDGFDAFVARFTL